MTKRKRFKLCPHEMKRAKFVAIEKKLFDQLVERRLKGLRLRHRKGRQDGSLLGSVSLSELQRQLVNRNLRTEGNMPWPSSNIFLTLDGSISGMK